MRSWRDRIAKSRELETVELGGWNSRFGVTLNRYTVRKGKPRPVLNLDKNGRRDCAPEVFRRSSQVYPIRIGRAEPYRITFWAYEHSQTPTHNPMSRWSLFEQKDQHRLCRVVSHGADSRPLSSLSYYRYGVLSQNPPAPWPLGSSACHAFWRLGFWLLFRSRV